MAMSSVSGTVDGQFETLHRALLIRDSRQNFWEHNQQAFSPADVALLMSEATRLALSGHEDTEAAAADCSIAYDIATRLASYSGPFVEQILPLCELVLSRLGNFPAKSLLGRTFANATSKDLDPLIALENSVRATENASPGGTIETLTDFQMRLLEELRRRKFVSVSAPTSAGKSTTLELDLLYRLQEKTSFTAVYLVPTRALIRQVSLDLSALLQENEVQASILSSISVPEQGDGSIRSRIVFVLTQERYATLLSEAPANFRVDSLIVDEAQEIGKAKRGVTLERVVSITLRRFPLCRVFFSTPLRSNPEYLLHLFRTAGQDSSSFIEHQRPVSQTIFLVKQIKQQTSKALLQILSLGTVSDLGEVELPFEFRGIYLAKLARHFTKPQETSIVYCNRGADADKRAEELGTLESSKDDEELSEFASFLRAEIHAQYRLADLVEKGIAFHYGNLPHIVRGRIEELAKQKKIRFVCCTSTLLQGVNLPAKNIFVENPKLGQGPNSTMPATDFWNLIGRAGRMNYEFNGNVFCVYGKKWESDPLNSSPLGPIESALEVALSERLPELATWATEPPVSAEGTEAWAEQAFANVYADFVTNRLPLRELRPESSNTVDLEKIDVASAEWFKRKTLPDALFQQNFYVHPSRLEVLADFFRRQNDLERYFPKNPFQFGSYDNLALIFKVIEDVFVKAANLSHRYFAFIALSWMKGESIKQLIQSRLEYRKIANEKKAINDEIRETFREIEDDIRFRYVKYTSIYLKVLEAVLLERNRSDQVSRLLPLNVFLEFGAAEVVLINLMSLGLSRTSALLLKRAITLRSDMSLEECRRYLRIINLNRIEIPAICKAEIRQIQNM